MALDFPSGPVNGTQYTDPNGVLWQYDGEKWDVIIGTTKKMFSGAKCSVSSSNDFATTSTPTPIIWDEEQFDTDTYFNTSVPTRLTAGATGYYRVNMTLYTDSTGSSYTVTIKKNDISVISTTVAGGQVINYDELVELNKDDYLSVDASEAGGVGSINGGSVIEIVRFGLAIGTGVTAFTAFSGVNVYRTIDFATTTTATAIQWTVAKFNTNADTSGNTYWESVTNPSRITVKATAYYRLRASLVTNSTGGNYTVTLKKNGSTTLITGILTESSTVTIDEVFEFTANDYLEIFVNDTDSSGSIDSESFFELIRLGF